jgi:hypothetical protein
LTRVLCSNNKITWKEQDKNMTIRNFLEVETKNVK